MAKAIDHQNNSKRTAASNGWQKGMVVGKKSVNNCTMAGLTNVDCGQRSCRQRGNRLDNNQPPTGALKVGSGLQPERRATTKGDVNDNNKEEGLSTSDEESRSDGKGGIEAKWRQKLEATTNHSRQYEEALGDNSQQEVA